MTTCWLAVCGALLCWPAPRLAERRLRSLAAADRLATRQASPGRRWQVPTPSPHVLTACAGAAGAVVGVTVGLPVGVALGLVVATAARLVARIAVRRRVAARAAALAAALRLLCAELEAGSSPASALAAAAEIPGESRAAFVAAADAVARGDDPLPLLRLHAPPDDAGFAALVAAWQVAADTGTPLAAVLSRVDADVAAERAQARAVAISVAGPRSSAAMLAGLPLLGIGLGAAMGARPLDLLLGTPVGQMVLCAGVLLDVLGLLWTKRVIDTAERA